MACFGNVLRGDDGVGAAVAERLLALPWREGVTIMDVGIGGIHMVQELMGGVDALVIVDAVDLGLDAGTVVVQQPDVADVSHLSDAQRRDELADMHFATPERALMLARGLGVLPSTTLIVGVQTTDTQRLGTGLSTVTDAAVQAAVDEVIRIVGDLTR